MLTSKYTKQPTTYKPLNFKNMKAISYKITWFENKSQRVTDKIFTGKDAFQKAVKWGKKTLENFNTDLIQTIFNY